MTGSEFKERLIDALPATIKWIASNDSLCEELRTKRNHAFVLEKFGKDFQVAFSQSTINIVVNAIKKVKYGY